MFCFSIFWSDLAGYRPVVADETIFSPFLTVVVAKWHASRVVGAAEKARLTATTREVTVGCEDKDGEIDSEVEWRR